MNGWMDGWIAEGWNPRVRRVVVTSTAQYAYTAVCNRIFSAVPIYFYV